MARFPQLERLAAYEDEDFVEKRAVDTLTAKEVELHRARRKKRRPINELPIDEVFRRINAGEYLE